MGKKVFFILFIISICILLYSEESLLGKWVIHYVSNGGPHLYETYEFKKDDTLIVTQVFFAGNIFKGEHDDYRNCIDETKEFKLKYKTQYNFSYKSEDSPVIMKGNFLTIECSEEDLLSNPDNLFNEPLLFLFSDGRLKIFSGNYLLKTLEKFTSDVDSMRKIFIEKFEDQNRAAEFLKFSPDKNLFGEWVLISNENDRESIFKEWFFDANGFLILDGDVTVYNIINSELILSNNMFKHKSYKYRINDNILEIFLNNGTSVKFKKNK